MSAADPHGNDALIARVRAAADSIQPNQRRAHAVVITPEDGVLVVTRGALAERLRSAGLERQATEAMQRCRDNDAILCWVEAGTGG